MNIVSFETAMLASLNETTQRSFDQDSFKMANLLISTQKSDSSSITSSFCYSSMYLHVIGAFASEIMLHSTIFKFLMCVQKSFRQQR